jgi:hypothetical protein
MEPDRTGKDAPRLTFSLELQVDSLLQTVVTLGGPLHESVHQALVQGLHELMETLGIPGEPEVAITVLERPLPDGRFLTIAVEDQLLRYSDETLRSIYCWLNDSVFRADVTPSEVLAWLLRISEPGTSESNHEMVAAFFRELSVAIWDALSCRLTWPRYRLRRSNPESGRLIRSGCFRSCVRCST